MLVIIIIKSAGRRSHILSELIFTSHFFYGECDHAGWGGMIDIIIIHVTKKPVSDNKLCKSSDFLIAVGSQNFLLVHIIQFMI